MWQITRQTKISVLQELLFKLLKRNLKPIKTCTVVGKCCGDQKAGKRVGHAGKGRENRDLKWTGEEKPH